MAIHTGGIEKYATNICTMTTTDIISPNYRSKANKYSMMQPNIPWHNQ